MTFSRIFPAALLLAAFSVHAAPKAAKKTPAAAAGRQDAGETVRRLPPIFRAAETDKTGFPQTGRAIWRLHADANGKIVRREQKTDRAVAKQAAAIGDLPQEFPPRERCVVRQSQSGASETVCRNVPFTVVQEVYFVMPKNPAIDKTQFAGVVQTVPPRLSSPVGGKRRRRHKRCAHRRRPRRQGLRRAYGKIIRPSAARPLRRQRHGCRPLPTRPLPRQTRLAGSIVKNRVQIGLIECAV